MVLEERMRRQVLERPRIKFVCERDWISGPHVFAFGALWSRDFEAMPGQSVYRRCFVLRFTMRLWLERR